MTDKSTEIRVAVVGFRTAAVLHPEDLIPRAGIGGITVQTNQTVVRL